LKSKLHRRKKVNSILAIGVMVVLGLFYSWTNRINGRFFFGRTADAEFRASEGGRAITRQYLAGVALATAMAVAMAWAGVHTGHRSLAGTGLLLQIVACWLIFARANGQVRKLAQGRAAGSREAVSGTVIQVPLLEQPMYWIPGLVAILLPAAASLGAVGVAVLLAAHGAGVSAGWAALGKSMDGPGDSFIAGIGSGMLAAATGLLLLFRGSARLRTKMAQYTVRSSISMEWIGAAMLIGVLGCNYFGVVLSRGIGRGVALAAMVAAVASLVWNQARAERFVPPPVEVGGDDRWRWGLFYVDRGDPALFVQSRCGAGYTLNYGRVAAWPISLGLVAYVVGVLFFLPRSR
jgi:hypothetical protein